LRVRENAAQIDDPKPSVNHWQAVFCWLGTIMSELRLDDAFLQQLIHEYDTPEVIGFGLSGSFARGDATRYSDVDLLRFVRSGERSAEMRYVEGVLLSLSTFTIEHERAQFSRPAEVIWIIPMLRRMRILLDRDGELARLQLDAELFDWESLRSAAEAHASHDLVGYTEELHKVLSALARRDEAAMAYATLGVVLGMVNIMAVAKGILVNSESLYFREVGTAIGTNSAWTHQLRLALGLGEESSVNTRAQASLRLYRETAKLLEPILRPEDRQVVHTCSTLLDQHTIGE
jgi:predicted nucleotidyltransferase